VKIQKKIKIKNTLNLDYIFIIQHIKCSQILSRQSITILLILSRVEKGV